MRRHRLSLLIAALVGACIAVALAACGSRRAPSAPPRPASSAAGPIFPGLSAGPTPGPAFASAARSAPEPGRDAAAAARFARIGLPVYCGAGRRREVALTFDDGPGTYTSQAQRLLRGAGITATFFLIGRNVIQRPGLAAADARLGEVGDHTLTHPVLTALRPPAIATEMSAGLTDVHRATGAPVLLFRPPYGAVNDAVRTEAHRLDVPTIVWNVDSRDSLGAGTAAVVHNAEAGLKPGAIILMHENTPGTRAGLPLILRAVRRDRLRPVTVAQLLADDPPSLAQLRAGYSGCLAAERHRR